MNMRMFAVAGLFAATVAGPAFAATTTYDDRATFNANATISNTATFDGKILPGFAGVYFGDVGGNNGVRFEGLNAELTIVRGDFAPGNYVAGGQYGSDYLRWESGLLTVSFLNPVIAVGFDFMDLTGRATAFTFNIDGVNSGFVTGATSKFFGLTTDTPFTSFTISSALVNRGENFGLFPTLDTLAYGYAPTRNGGVPEPGAWALMLLGFGGLGTMLRRKRAAAFA